MPHDISQRVNLSVMVFGGPLLLDGVGEQIVVFGPQLLVRSEQRSVVLVIAVLVGQKLFYFVFVKDGILFLDVDFLVLAGQTGTDPFEIVAKRNFLAFFG